MEIKASPDVVGEPIDILVAFKGGYKWINRNQYCFQ